MNIWRYPVQILDSRNMICDWLQQRETHVRFIHFLLAALLYDVQNLARVNALPGLGSVQAEAT